MSVRLVALDEGPDIPVDRAVVVVGRHPQCDARIDSIRVSRRHCCMTSDSGELVVRDLGSTNGIRINGQRVEMGRLRAGEELSIAHIRYRLEIHPEHEVTLADTGGSRVAAIAPGPVPRRSPTPPNLPAPPNGVGKHAEPLESAVRVDHPNHSDDSPLAAAVRGLLPADMADRCRVKVIVKLEPETADSEDEAEEAADACRQDSSP